MWPTTTATIATISKANAPTKPTDWRRAELVESGVSSGTIMSAAWTASEGVLSNTSKTGLGIESPDQPTAKATMTTSPAALSAPRMTALMIAGRAIGSSDFRIV